MTRETRLDRAARIVIEAAVAGDKATCSKYRITRRTLQRYRRQIEQASDPKLVAAVAEKKAAVERDWAEQVPSALKAGVEFLERASKEASPKDPAAIHSIEAALKMLSEVAATWKLLDVRLSRAAGQAGAQDQSGASGGGHLRAVR